jgi:hypothetical protein
MSDKKAEIEKFVRLWHQLPREVASAARKTMGFQRDGNPAIEVVVEWTPMRIGKLTLDKAIAETAAAVQSWAESRGAPTTFEGCQVIYRSQDSCEAPDSRSKDGEIREAADEILFLIRVIYTRKVGKNGDRTPLHEVHLRSSVLADDLGLTAEILFAPFLPCASMDEVRAFSVTHSDRIMDQTRDESAYAVKCGILLRAGFSDGFRKQFDRALNEAGDVVNSIPELSAIIAESEDEESVAPVNMEHYRLLAIAEEQIGQLLHPVFEKHSSEWVDLISRAFLAPASLGFEPDAELFSHDEPDWFHS